MMLKSRNRPGSVDTLSRGRGGNWLDGAHLIVIGLIFVGWFLVNLMTQVTTNEAWIDHVSTVNVYRPDLTVFLQVPYILLGWIPADRVPGIMFSWGIELVFLAITQAGIELIHRAAHTSGVVLGIFFEIVAFGGCCFNWATDYAYGTVGSGPWGHFLFALMTSVFVGYFGNIGIFLIRRGWSQV